MSLAGGLKIGDRVSCQGLTGSVLGRPSRVACSGISVAVRFDDGRIADERVQNVELLIQESLRASDQLLQKVAHQQDTVRQDAAQPSYGGHVAPAPTVLRNSQRSLRSCKLDDALAQGKGAFFPKTCQMRGALGMDATLVEKMRPYAHPSGWKELMPATLPMYDMYCTRGENRRSDFLTCEQAKQFFREVGFQFFGQDISSILDDDKFERFDFDGSGGLSHLEVFRCLRHCLMEKFDELGLVHHDEHVQMKTPSQAGIEKIKELARGGQGSAWLADSRRYGQVCLKIYSKQNPNAGGIADLIHETEIARQLNASSYICHSFEIFQDLTSLYGVNELMPGGDLTCMRRKALKEGVPLTEEYFRKVFKQCLKGLSHIHMHAIIHCDLKEPNIMMRNTDIADPRIAIIDLGISVAASGPGLAGGTPGYRPPETNATDVWYPKGDIFSLGVTFFQLLGNKTPDEKTGQLGIFQEGAHDLDDVIKFTATRPLPMHLIQRYPGTHSWLPQMMSKHRRNRLVAIQLLSLPWFMMTNEEIEDEEVMEAQAAEDEQMCCPFDTMGLARFAPRDEPQLSPEASDQNAKEVDWDWQFVERPEGDEVSAQEQNGPDEASAPRAVTFRNDVQDAEEDCAPDAASGAGDEEKALDEEQLRSIRVAFIKLRNRVEFRHRNVYSAFKACDKEHKGWLTRQNLSDVLLLDGVKLCPAAFDSVWYHFDTEGNGVISPAGFRAAVCYNGY